MLISLSGAQGSGKTTVLNRIKELGYNVIERKTSRSILAEWNTTLDAVYKDPVVCKEFQTELLRRKEQDEKEAVESSELCFTERSYADVFTYTLLTLGRYNENNEWIDEYYNKCKELNGLYLGLFYLEGGAFKTVADGVRGINRHYVRNVDETLFSTLNQMNLGDPVTFIPCSPLVIVRNYTKEVDDRAREIVANSQHWWLQKRLPLKEITL